MGATDDTDTFPAVSRRRRLRGTTTDEPSRRATSGVGQATRQAWWHRLPQLSVAIVAGLLLCTSFPPFGWWYAAVAAFALLAWVLTRRIHDARRRVRLRLPVRAGVLSPAAAVDQRAGRRGSLAGAVRSCEAVFPALFGLLAVAVRRLPGWPLWFAAVWARAGMAQVDRAIRRISLGRSRFQPDQRPATAARAARRRAAAVVRGGADRLQLARNRVRGVEVVAQRPRAAHDRRHRRAVVLPGVCICVVLLDDRVGVAARPAVRRRRRRRAGRSPSPPCRATCRGSGWSSTPSAARCWTTTSAKPFGWPTRCAPAGRRSRSSSSGRRTPRTSTHWPTRTPATQISIGRGGDQGADPGRRRRRGPGLQPPTTRRRPTRSSSGIPPPAPANGTTSRSCSRSASTCRGAASSAICRPTPTGPATSCPGSGNGVVHAAGVPVGVTTCWEVIFDRAARESVRNGAQLLAVPTNNATFDEAMSEQQLAFGRLRAVEHDRYVVVAGTTGYQRGHRARRPRAGPHRLLRTRLPRHPGAAEDAAHARNAVGSRRRRACWWRSVLPL